jgi:hypothetical protein
VQHFKLVVVGCGIADRDALERIGLRGRADVDPHLVPLGDLFAVLGVHEVHGALAGDSPHVAVGRADDDAPAGDHDPVVPADRVEVEEAVLVHVGYHQPDLVDVAGEHEDGVALRVERRDPVAEPVGAVNVGVRFDVAVEDFLRLLLVAGRRSGVEQVDQELGGGCLFRHPWSQPASPRAGKAELDERCA